MGYNLKEILAKFDIIESIEPYGNGHINDTYIAATENGFILQRINTNVFKNPVKVMENIEKVTEHLRKKIAAYGGNVKRETLTVIKTLDGKPYYESEDGDFFRMYNFITNAVSYDMAENPNQFYQSARAFGKFQRLLADFPAEELFETIPRFHDTANRFENFKKALAEDKMGRAKDVQDEINFILAREKDCSVILDAMKDGSVPVRVTHNDTKLNNVMLDAETDEGVCVIDLDTVMAGSLLYDFGDSIRFGASSATEDEEDLSKVFMRMELFDIYTKGYMEELCDVLTEKEIELLPFAAKLLTFECGMRFLTDYLEGDTYFKIHKPDHNLHRTRTQLKLVYDMEQKMDEMAKAVRKYVK